MRKDIKSDKRYANTLARGLSILRAFAPSDNGLGNLELSERTGIPRSTVSRLTFTLCEERYLTHGRHQDKYYLGPAAFALGNIAAANFRFVEIAGPVMQGVADESGHLVGVAIHDDGDMLMVKTWRPKGSSAIWLEVGYRIPMLTSSTGLAYLGALENEELERIAMRLEDGKKSTKYRKSATAAKDELIARGFVSLVGAERYSKKISAVAVPFRTTEFVEPVSFFCSGSSADLTDDMMQKQVGPTLGSAVRDLQGLTGHRPMGIHP